MQGLKHAKRETVFFSPYVFCVVAVNVSYSKKCREAVKIFLSFIPRTLESFYMKLHVWVVLPSPPLWLTVSGGLHQWLEDKIVYKNNKIGLNLTGTWNEMLVIFKKNLYIILIFL